MCDRGSRLEWRESIPAFIFPILFCTPEIEFTHLPRNKFPGAWWELEGHIQFWFFYKFLISLIIVKGTSFFYFSSYEFSAQSVSYLRFENKHKNKHKINMNKLTRRFGFANWAELSSEILDPSQDQPPPPLSLFTMVPMAVCFRWAPFDQSVARVLDTWPWSP